MKEELATIPTGLEGMITLERPEGHDDGTLGNESIGRADILMPRLGLAQKMSPEIDPTNTTRYIEGLQFTDLFHSLTKKNLGKGPLHFVILRRDRPRWVEFNPLAQGGGIKDPDVRFGDPRTRFGANGEKPIATEFHDYIILLLTDLDAADPMQSVIALSLKSSAIRTAKKLNLLIQLRGQKLICKGVYELRTSSATDKKTNGVYATYEVKNVGWLTPGSAIEELAIGMFNAWKERKVVIDADSPDDIPVEHAEEGDASFDTTQM